MRFLFAAIVIFPLLCAAQEGFKYGARVKSYSMYEPDRSFNESYHTVFVNPEIKYFHKKFQFVVSPAVTYSYIKDTNSFIQSDFNYSGYGDQQYDYFFNETYVSYLNKSFSARLGYLKYLFGTSDFLNPTRQLNSINTRYLFLGDKDEVEATPAFDLACNYKGVVKIQLGILPFHELSKPFDYHWLTRYDKEMYEKFSTDKWLRDGIEDSLDVPDQETVNLLVDAIGSEIAVRNTYEKWTGFKSMQYFGRLEMNFLSWQVNMMYAHLKPKLAVQKIISKQFFLFNLPDSIVFVYPAYDMYGLDFEKAIAEFSIRAEFAYNTMEYQVVSYNNDPDSVKDYSAETSSLSWILGIDRFLPLNMYINLQFFHKHLFHYVDDAYNMKMENDYGLVATLQKRADKDRLKFSVDNAYDFAFKDGMLSLSADASYIKNLKITIGARCFYNGKSDGSRYWSYGRFGSYARNDHIFVLLKYYL